MCRGRSSTVIAGCLELFAACAVAQAQEQQETKRLDADVTVQVESSDAENKGGPTLDDADAGTEPKVSEADRRRANELDRQAKRTMTRARELARQAKRMAEEARQLAQQAAELRGDDLSPDLGWGLFEKEDRQTPPTAQTQGQKQPLKLDDIIGMSVKNDRAEDLGVVEDVVLDSSSGQIRYAAFSFGGWLGIDDKLFAVPWGAFRLTNGGDERVLVLNKTKKQLREAPGFDQDD